MNKTEIKAYYEDRLKEMYNQVEHYKERWEISQELYEIERKVNTKLSEEIAQLKANIGKLL